VDLRDSYADADIGFLAVSIAGPPARVRKAADQMGFDWPLAITDGNLLDALGISEVPATIFVDAEGRIVGVAEGAQEEPFFRRRTAWLLDRVPRG
jgi:hypothetical protein